MEKTIKIREVCCNGCAAKIEDALYEIKGVRDAEVTCKNDIGSAIISAEDSVTDDALKKCVEECGFEVISVE